MATQHETRNNAPLPDGIVFGGYRIVRKIARGGFSIVYLAEDSLGTKFAIKEYLPKSLVMGVAGSLAEEAARVSASMSVKWLDSMIEAVRQPD